MNQDYFYLGLGEGLQKEADWTDYVPRWAKPSTYLPSSWEEAGQMAVAPLPPKAEEFLGYNAGRFAAPWIPPNWVESGANAQSKANGDYGTVSIGGPNGFSTHPNMKRVLNPPKGVSLGLQDKGFSSSFQKAVADKHLPGLLNADGSVNTATAIQKTPLYQAATNPLVTSVAGPMIGSAVGSYFGSSAAQPSEGTQASNPITPPQPRYSSEGRNFANYVPTS